MNGCKKCPAYAKCTETYRGSGCAALRWTYSLDSDPKLDCTDREKLIELLKKPIYPHLDADPAEVVADYLLDNGATVLQWISVEDDKPAEFVSVLGHMTDSEEFPAVRECYWTGDSFFFPALREKHPVDRWMEMPE